MVTNHPSEVGSIATTKADYHETSEFGDGAVVSADFDDYRLLAVLEAEVGVRWQSKAGRWSANAGFQAMGFLGHITTSKFIHEFQHGSFNDLGDVLNFSGFILRPEAGF